MRVISILAGHICRICLFRTSLFACWDPLSLSLSLLSRTAYLAYSAYFQQRLSSQCSSTVDPSAFASTATENARACLCSSPQRPKRLIAISASHHYQERLDINDKSLETPLWRRISRRDTIESSSLRIFALAKVVFGNYHLLTSWWSSVVANENFSLYSRLLSPRFIQSSRSHINLPCLYNRHLSTHCLFVHRQHNQAHRTTQKKRVRGIFFPLVVAVFENQHAPLRRRRSWPIFFSLATCRRCISFPTTRILRPRRLFWLSWLFDALAVDRSWKARARAYDVPRTLLSLRVIFIRFVRPCVFFAAYVLICGCDIIRSLSARLSSTDQWI